MNDFKATMQSYFKGLKDLVVKLIVKPADFFRDMPRTGGILDPLIFVLLASLLGVVLNAIELLMTSGVGMGMVTVWLITVPIVMVIMSFFVAGICYAAWAFMGSKENFETSYRCLAYMQILFPIMMLVSIVPYLGLACIAWWLYLMVIATREVHKVSVKPALAVFGIIAAIVGLIYYSSVSSTMKSKERIEEYTKELQKMPGANDMGNPANR